MFKIFEKAEKVSHFSQLIEQEDYTAIMEKMEQGYEMTLDEEKSFNHVVENRIKNEGVIFLSDLYKEGFDISDEWLLRWTKSRKFVTNYNLPVFGANYFKERLENLAPDILSFYLYRMDNLSMGISRSYKVCFMQAVEVMTSVRNYSKIIEHIETGISDKNLNEYYQKLKNLNSIVDDSASFYQNLDANTRINDYIKDMETIIAKRAIEKKLADKTVTAFVIPHNIQDYIKRIYDNYEKCIENKQYLKPSTIEVLDKIKDEKVERLINKFKEDEDKEFFLGELKKMDNAISSVLVGVTKQKMTEANREYFIGRPRKRI